MTTSRTEAWSRYEATSARQNRPWDRNAVRDVMKIDMHAHAASREAVDFVARHAPSAPPAADVSPTSAVEAMHKRDTDPLLYDPELRLERMDAMGIDFQLVSPAPHFHSYYTLPAEIALPATRMANEGMAAFAARRADRFAALGTVALQEPKAAAEELRRCIAELGLKGVQVLGHIDHREISDPNFDPFWAAAADLDALVLVHGSGNRLGGRLNRYNFGNAIGNPLETTIALSHLISDGVLERHPNLRILGAHGGGFLGAYSGRFDHNWGARADGYNGMPHPPSHYLKRNVYVDSVVFTPHQLRCLIDVFGADHVVLGTDFPFNMGEFEPVEHVMNLDGLDAGNRDAVLGGTARTLLGI